MKSGKIIPGVGISGNFVLNQPVSQVLFKLQSQPKSFGPLTLLTDELSLGQPMFLVLETGYRFRFDPVFQRLNQIEVFIDLQRLREQSQRYTIPDVLLGSFEGAPNAKAPLVS